jgi:hypothetical protein
MRSSIRLHHERKGFHLGRLPRMGEDEDEDDDPQPDAFSTLYDPLRGLRERWFTRLNWWQKVLLIVGAFVAVVGFSLLTTLKII